MSGTDQIVINTRERASSGDVNDLQSLKDRTLLDSWLEAFQLRSYSVGAQPTELSQPIVLGGLEVGPSGTDIAIQAGVLLQDSTTLSPVPGALDSDYRWAALRSSIIESNPLPGADTWYLIEAQMDDVVAATATRDIFDTGTGLFVPTLVDKRTERAVVVQLVAGTTTNLPLPSGGDWVVIGAVLVPTGGGAIPAANFMDLRPLWTDLTSGVQPSAVSGRRRSTIATVGKSGDATKELRMAAEAFTLGRRLWFETDDTGILLTAGATGAEFRVGTPATGTTISYLYLTPLRDAASRALLVRNAYAHAGLTGLNGNALLVWSSIAPGADRESNSATITLPAPFANYTVPIGEAICVGALYSSAGAPNFVAQGPDGWNAQRVNEAQGYTNLSDTFAPTGGADTVSIAAPACARLCHYKLRWVQNGSGDTNQDAFIDGTGVGWVFGGNWNERGHYDFTVEPGDFTVEFNGANVPTTAVVDLIGWSL